jgi:hypothetical protein
MCHKIVFKELIKYMAHIGAEFTCTSMRTRSLIPIGLKDL